MEKLLKQTAKGVGIVFIGLLIGYVLKYVSYILFARILGPGDYGLVSLGMALLGILGTISLLGFTSGVPRFISYFKDKKITRGIVKAAFKYVLGVSICISLLFILFSTQISTIFNKPSFAEVLPFFMITLPFYALIELGSSIFRGIKKF